MNGLSQWKVVLYLVGIFLAGGVSGWVVATTLDRQKAIKPPQPREIYISWRDRLHANLNLSPDQAQQIDGILDRSSAEIGAIHSEHIKRIKQGVSNRNAQITALLTPEQQTQFEQMEKERQESSRARDAWRSKNRGRSSDPSRDKRGSTNQAERVTNTPTESHQLRQQ